MFMVQDERPASDRHAARQEWPLPKVTNKILVGTFRSAATGGFHLDEPGAAVVCAEQVGVLGIAELLVKINDRDASRFQYRLDGADELLAGPVEQTFANRRGCALGFLELPFQLATAGDIVRFKLGQRASHVTFMASHEGLVGRELTSRPTHHTGDELGQPLLQQPLKKQRPWRLTRYEVAPLDLVWRYPPGDYGLAKLGFQDRRQITLNRVPYATVVRLQHRSAERQTTPYGRRVAAQHAQR